MSEMEQLKRAAEESRVKQRYDELSAYIDRLMGRMDVDVKKSMDAGWVYLACWVAWVALDILLPAGRGLWVLLFIFGLMYQHYFDLKLHKTFSELDGVFETLGILGMLPEVPDRPKRRRRTWHEGVDMVKGWFEKATKAKEGAYKPA